MKAGSLGGEDWDTDPCEGREFGGEDRDTDPCEGREFGGRGLGH